MNYGQYIAFKSVTNYGYDNSESDGSGDFDIDTQQNQGAIDSGPDENFNANNNTEPEGSNRNDDSKTTPQQPVTRVTRSKVNFENPITTPDPQIEPPKCLSRELKSLYSNFVKDVEGAGLIAGSLLMDFDKAVKTILALIGRTDDSVDVPQIFQEA